MLFINSLLSVSENAMFYRYVYVIVAKLLIFLDYWCHSDCVSGIQFLHIVSSEWAQHCQQMVSYIFRPLATVARSPLLLQIMIRSIFLYLDRTYVIENSSLLSIW